MNRIEIKGPIISNDDKWIYDLFEMDSTSPKDVHEAIPSDNSEIEVLINSGGGDVYSGSEIYTELKSYAGQVTVKVIGLAASAASVIAMAGDKVEISPTAHLMIHNVSSITRGDHNDHEKSTNILASHDKSIANAYILKTGKSQEELLNLMDEETWMDADTAVENGFADEVMFQEEEVPQLVASAQTPVLPNKAINKCRAFYQKDKASDMNDEKMEAMIDQLADKIINKLGDNSDLTNTTNTKVDDETKNNNSEENQQDKKEEQKSNNFLANFTKAFNQLS